MRLCIPKTERKRILHEHHDKVAHPGIIHLYDSLRERVWWPRMLRDVLQYVSKCTLCQQTKGNKSFVAPRSMDIPTAPWSHVHVDHVGPFPTTDKGNKYILVIIDRFTRYAEAIAVESITAYDTARLIVEHVICRHGPMEVLTSDRGTGFVGHVVGQIFKILGVNRIRTSAHHPQSNGVIEIFNKTLKTTLRLWCDENQRDWDELLAFALYAYNTSFHSLMQETPFYLNAGRQARTITDNITASDALGHRDVHAYAVELTQKLTDTHQRVREILEKVNEEREIYNDECMLPVHEVGDQVLLFDPTTSKGMSRKLVRRWTGPYTVIQKNSDVNYTIMKKDKTQKVHVERLRKYNDVWSPSDVSDVDELQLARSEVQAIQDEIVSLQQRKSDIEKQQSIIEANVEQNAINQAINDVNVGVEHVSIPIASMWL